MYICRTGKLFSFLPPKPIILASFSISRCGAAAETARPPARRYVGARRADARRREGIISFGFEVFPSADSQSSAWYALPKACQPSGDAENPCFSKADILKIYNDPEIPHPRKTLSPASIISPTAPSYHTRLRYSPCGGMVGPVSRRSPFSSRAGISSGLSLPWAA